MQAGPHDRNDDFMTHEPPELQRVQTQERDREITLNMGTILGIFFALALSWALLFGMGYTLGRRSSQPQTTADGTASDAGSFSSFKPSPQSIAVQPVPATTAPAVPANSADTTAYPAPSANNTASATAASVPASDMTRSAAAAPAPKAVPAAIQPAAPIFSSPVPAAPQSSIVQVAAVSHQEDADILLSALKRQGYAVFARQVPEDKLIHIQIGPFANRKDADAMRQRLLADGYTAIVK